VACGGSNSGGNNSGNSNDNNGGSQPSNSPSNAAPNSPAATSGASPPAQGNEPVPPGEGTASAASKEEIIRGIIGNDTDIYGEFLTLVGGDVGFVTDDVDHHARNTYHFAFVGSSSSAATKNLLNGLVKYQNYFNFQLDESYSDGDNDRYITLLETYALHDIDGFFLNADINIFARVTEVADELGVPYVFMLTPFRNSQGQSMVPAIGEDDAFDGAIVMTWLLDNYVRVLGDINMDDVGVLGLHYSTSIPMRIRMEAARDVWNARFPGREDQFYFIDTAAQTPPIAPEASFNEVAAFVSSRPDVKYWIIGSATGMFANGAARALESLSLDKNAIICSVGIEELINEWNAGYDGCWAACVSINANIYCMPMLAGLLALADGRATPQTLWSDLRAPGDIATYYIMEATLITRDTYLDYGKACEVIINHFSG